MITEQNLKNIFNILTDDESFCRLLYYGDSPFDETKPDVTEFSDYKNMLMNDYIFFSPQIEGLSNKDTVRICLFKNYSKIRDLQSVVRFETIQFDLYVPHRLQNLDMRLYKLENKISSLLDKLPVNIGFLDYVDGNTVPIPAIMGYALYRMIFKMEESRPTYGKY